MYRRLYFLFPDLPHATLAVDELLRDNIPQRHLHTLAHRGTDMHAVSARTCPSGHQLKQRLERFALRCNPPVCFAALAALLLMVNWVSVVWLMIPVGVLMTNLLAILYFSTRIPLQNISHFEDVLRNGEILLMVDVPFRRVPEIQYQLHRRHPEACIAMLEKLPTVSGNRVV